MMAQMASHNLQGRPSDTTTANQFGQGLPPLKRGVSESPLQSHSGLLGTGGFGTGFQSQQQTGSNSNNMWQTGFDAGMVDGQSPSDSWSNSSTQGQPVPSTLNVEDW